MNTENTDNKLKQNLSKTIFDNLKTDYFLIKILDYTTKKKSLEILKYSKKLQKRLNLNINDYKKYSQYYSLIELTLTLDNYKKNDKFINIPDSKREYYHIYFDDSIEEIKRNYLNEKENIKMIKIIINHQVKSFKNLFDRCKCISSILFKKFYRIDITDMSFMFFGCSSLKELNISNLITDNVTNMNCMFFECSSLKEIESFKF